MLLTANVSFNKRSQDVFLDGTVLASSRAPMTWLKYKLVIIIILHLSLFRCECSQCVHSECWRTQLLCCWYTVENENLLPFFSRQVSAQFLSTVTVWIWTSPPGRALITTHEPHRVRAVLCGGHAAIWHQGSNIRDVLDWSFSIEDCSEFCSFRLHFTHDSGLITDFQVEPGRFHLLAFSTVKWTVAQSPAAWWKFGF